MIDGKNGPPMIYDDDEEERIKCKENTETIKNFNSSYQTLLNNNIMKQIRIENKNNLDLDNIIHTKSEESCNGQQSVDYICFKE